MRTSGSFFSWVDYARVSQGAWLSNKSLGLSSRLLIELNADLSQSESNLVELKFRKEAGFEFELDWNCS